eukprot:scaffold45520_cov64-Phaeocystis_antarctica.AAC.9
MWPWPDLVHVRRLGRDKKSARGEYFSISRISSQVRLPKSPRLRGLVPLAPCRRRVPAQHRQAAAVAHMGACCKWLQVAPEVASSWPSAVPSVVPVRLLLGSAPQ